MARKVSCFTNASIGSPDDAELLSSLLSSHAVTKSSGYRLHQLGVVLTFQGLESLINPSSEVVSKPLKREKSYHLADAARVEGTKPVTQCAAPRNASRPISPSRFLLEVEAAAATSSRQSWTVPCREQSGKVREEARLPYYYAIIL